MKLRHYFVLLLLPTFIVACKEEIPQEDLVIDDASLLTEDEAGWLNDMLNEYKQQSEAEFVYYSTESLNGWHMDDLSAQIVEDVGVGEPGINNGLLVLLAEQEETIRIWTQHGIEWQVTDSIARIVRDEMITHLNESRFYDALLTGFNMLFEQVKEYSWQVNFYSLKEALDSGEALKGKIVTLVNYNLPQSISINSIQEKQFDESLKVEIQSEGRPVELYHSRYMDRLVEHIINQDVDTIYARFREANTPLKLELMGVSLKEN